MKIRYHLQMGFASCIAMLLTLTIACAEDAVVGYALVAKSGESTQILDVKSREKLFESTDSREAIEWALLNRPITVISAGIYSLSAHVSIPRSNVSLVIAENAELITERDAKVIKLSESHGGYYPQIYNGGHDNVNVINFGTLNPDIHKAGGEEDTVNVCIMYDGRSDGENGISGGIIFSCGQLLTTGDAAWIVDSENIRVPLMWSRTTCNTLAIEGGDHIRLGTIAELNNVGRPRGQGRPGNEAIDLNSYCHDVQCELAIGTAPLEETVDVNNSTDCIFEEVRAYGQCNRLYKFTTYKPHQRRLTQKGYIDNSEGTVFKKKGDYRHLVVKAWKTEFQVEDLLENLPIVQVTAKLTGEFENHPTEEVLNETFTINLTNL